MSIMHINYLASSCAETALELRVKLMEERFVEFRAVEDIERAISTLQDALMEVLEDFDEEDKTGFRKPKPSPTSFYDTLEEKRQ